MKKRIILLLTIQFLVTGLLFNNNVYALPSEVRHAPVTAPTTKSNGSGSSIIVASSDTSAKGQASADYVCPGTNCGVTINTAIAALSPAGGRIILLEGTYEIEPSGINNSSKNILLEGQGNSTVLRARNGATGGGLIRPTQAGLFIVRNIRMDGNKSSGAQLIGADTRSTSAIVTGSFSNLTLENMAGQAIYDFGEFPVRDSFLNNNNCGIRMGNTAPDPLTGAYAHQNGQVHDIIGDFTGTGTGWSCANSLNGSGILVSVRNNVLINTTINAPELSGVYSNGYSYLDPNFSMHLAANNIITGNGFSVDSNGGSLRRTKTLFNSNIVTNSLTTNPGINVSGLGIVAVGNILAAMPAAAGISDNGGIVSNSESTVGNIFSANIMANNANGYAKSLSIAATILSDNVITDNTKTGLFLSNGDTSAYTYQSVKSLLTVGNLIANNSTSLNNSTYNNVYIEAPVFSQGTNYVPKLNFQGNTIRTGTNANKPKYGLATAGGSYTILDLIINNDIQAAGTGAINDGIGATGYNWAGSTTVPGLNLTR